ncbi:wdr75 [Symbiodinium necroappetens]|uniref:Wdr75 protein n=1 Tax=Symbiodinium necroappetens TaxID=1628268 RepID=A0A813AMG8_9DINO|nr:wdr75 [Symbiodinium necroappetens]
MEPSKQTSNTVRLSSGQSIRPPVLGGLISGKKPAVTPDGSRVFAACGNLAIGFSTRTSRRLGVLGPLRGTVTATAGGLPGNTSADSPQAVATGSSFGELVIWDAKSLQKLSHLQFDEPVLHVIWPSKNIIMVFLGQRGATVTAEVVSVDSLESTRKLRKTPLSMTNSNGPAAATEDVIALVDGKDLVVWADGWSNSQRYTHSHPLTSVAIDPARRYVCAGDCRGVLWTWWGILEKEGVDATMAVPARWHWHANEILALEHCGPVLLSAGREGVLCVRNMEDETLQFIPRFPTALRHMTATDDGQVVCSLEDNSLAVISSIHGWVRPQYIYSVDLPDTAPVPSRRTKKRKRFQQSEEPATLPKKQTAKSRIFHNLAGCQIGISSGRRVQFLSPGEMQPSKAQRLHRGGTANSDPKQRWALQQLVFSADASCIMTCETRLSPALEHFDPASAFSCMLKWWRRTDTDQYVLDSVSNNPHTAEVTVAIANPDFRYMFATASLDGNYKLWDRLPVEEKKEGKEPLHCWQCLAMGSWQRRPIHAGCFSPDGSLLAMGSTGSIVLWDADQGEELEILDLDQASDKPQQLTSAVANGMFMLIGCVSGQGKDEILCWDLESLEVFVRLDLGAALPGRGCCEMRCALPPGAPLDIMAFRSGEAAVMTWRLTVTEASKSPKKKRKSLEGSPTSKKARREEALPLPLPPKMAFVEQASATLPQQHAVIDATFRTRSDGVSSILCWTSTQELWDIDPAGADVSMEKDNVATQPEEEPLPRNAGPLASMTSGRAAVEASRPGFVLPRRTTAAQQAGLVPRLVQRVVPPHVPSHLLPPPAVLWAGFLSVFAKPPDSSQPMAPFSVKAGSELQPEKEVDDLPPWADPSGKIQDEFVDAAWMDARAAAVSFRELCSIEDLPVSMKAMRSLLLLLAWGVEALPEFPESWGSPPMVMTMDYVPLAGGYGHGSSSLSMWIYGKIQEDILKGRPQFPPAFGPPPKAQTRDLRVLPFGYGHGSGTMVTWLEKRAKEVFQESPHEFEPMEQVLLKRAKKSLRHVEFVQ